MNAVHDLAVLVARDEGLFEKEGLGLEILATPGTGQLGADRQALKKDIFDRTMEGIYNDGGVDQYRMCEWGGDEAHGGSGRERAKTGQDRCPWGRHV